MTTSTIAASLVSAIHNAEHRFANRITTTYDKDFAIKNATIKAFAQTSETDALFEDFMSQLDAHEIKCPFCGKGGN